MPIRRKDRAHIVTDILYIAKDGAAKSDIMYKAALSFDQLNEYLAGLEKVNLLRKTTLNDRPQVKFAYKTTEEGIKFLNDIEFPLKKLKELKKAL